jgi:hypothetical protein
LKPETSFLAQVNAAYPLNRLIKFEKVFLEEKANNLGYKEKESKS